MDKLVQFKLRNGLNATLYPTKISALKRLLNACTGRNAMGLTGISLFVVGVRVEDEHLYLLYTYSHTPEATVAKLRENLRMMKTELECNYAVIYNNAIYSFYNSTNATMIEAILHKIKPGLAALVT